MIDDFFRLKQDIWSNSCLPTAVRAILLWYGDTISQDTVAEWCEEGPLGCSLSIATQGLRDHDLIVTELSANAEGEISLLVSDPDDPVPVLLTIQTPFSPAGLDHAVVVVGIERVVVDGQTEEYVFFMDPSTGEIEREPCHRFWRMWDDAGRRAFVIDRP